MTIYRYITKEASGIHCTKDTSAVSASSHIPLFTERGNLLSPDRAPRYSRVEGNFNGGYRRSAWTGVQCNPAAEVPMHSTWQTLLEVVLG